MKWHCVFLFFFVYGFANPHDPVIVSGDVGLQKTPTVFQIQASDNAVLHWDDFSIDEGESVQFIQPHEKAIVLNRVLGPHPSSIFGSIQANGRVLLMNPNGIFVGSHAIIDTRAFSASTVDVLDRAFLSKEGLIRDSGPIEISGTIICRGGHISLMGETVRLMGHACLDVSGEKDGGNLTIGNMDTSSTKFISIGHDVILRANAGDLGNGGIVHLFGENGLQYEGTIEARGGNRGGDGGFVDLSSCGFLSPTGRVDTRAPMGRTGSLVLDPTQVIISTAGNSGIATSPPPGYTFSASPANISIASLVGFLMTSDVTINATASGPGAVSSITLNAGADAPAGAAVMWDSTPLAPTKLTLIADTITIRNSITSLHLGALAATPVIELNGQTVVIGDPSHTLANVVNITSMSGKILVNATSSLSLYGGTGGNTAFVMAGGVGFPGDLEVNGGSILLKTSTIAGASNGVRLGTISGDLVVNALDITLNSTGGTMTNNAFIDIFPGPGTLSVSGRNISLIGGTAGSGSSALISNAGGPLSVSATGNLSLIGGTSDLFNIAWISTSGANQPVFVNVAGNLFMQANDASAQIVTVGLTSPIDLRVGGNLTMLCGTGVGSQAVVATSSAAITAMIGGDSLFIGGSGDFSPGGFNAAGTLGIGDLIISGRNFTFIGGAGSESFAGLFTGFPGTFPSGGDGSIFVTVTGSSGITMTGGSGSFTPGLIETAGSGLNNNIDIVMTHPNSNLILNGPTVGGLNSGGEISTQGGGAINISVGRNIFLNGTALNPARIEMGMGGSENFLALAGRSISLNSYAQIQNLGSGDLTLVADNNFPSPFLFGPGAFNAATDAFLNTGGGALRIFTSRRQQNAISTGSSAHFNGIILVPGTLFIDTSQEIWCTYFPSTLGGAPFTIFYKDCIQELTFQAQLIDSEMLFDFNCSKHQRQERFSMHYAEDLPVVVFPYFIPRQLFTLIHLPN